LYEEEDDGRSGGKENRIRIKLKIKTWKPTPPDMRVVQV